MTLVFTQHFPFNQHDLLWNALTLTYAALVDDAVDEAKPAEK
jgi:hypothetical protein